MIETAIFIKSTRTSAESNEPQELKLLVRFSPRSCILCCDFLVHNSSGSCWKIIFQSSAHRFHRWPWSQGEARGQLWTADVFIGDCPISKPPRNPLVHWFGSWISLAMFGPNYHPKMCWMVSVRHLGWSVDGQNQMISCQENRIGVVTYFVLPKGTYIIRKMPKKKKKQLTQQYFDVFSIFSP